jgi:hypothetical protein
MTKTTNIPVHLRFESHDSNVEGKVIKIDKDVITVQTVMDSIFEFDATSGKCLNGNHFINPAEAKMSFMHPERTGVNNKPNAKRPGTERFNN